MADWQLLGARSASTVASLATASGAGSAAILFAATPAGIHRSSDGGRTWATVSLGQLGPAIEVVAVSPAFARDGTLFVGAASGLYRSRDSGATWQLVLTGSRMLSVAISPTFDRDGLLFVATDADGVLRSDDGGGHWTSANPGIVDLVALAIALSPRFETDRTGFAATASGLYRTRNGGRAWRAADLGPDEPAVQCLAVSPRFADDRFVLAGTEADGVLESRDGGVTWQTVQALGRQGVAALAIAGNGRTVAAATVGGVAISHDAGMTWRTTGEPRGPVLSLVFVADDSHESLLAGRARLGLARLDLGTTSWLPAGEGLHGGLVVALGVSATLGGTNMLCSASLEAGVEVSRDGGASWSAANDGLTDTTVLDLATSPDGTLYAATPDGLFANREAAVRWRRVAGGAVRKVVVGSQPAIVLAALEASGLKLSTDGGISWRELASPAASVLSLGLSPDFAGDRTLFAGAAAPTGDNELALWRSTDGGQGWQRILSRRGSSALPLAVPSTFPVDGMLFVGCGGQVLQPHRAQGVGQGAPSPPWRAAALPGGPQTVTALAFAADSQGADGGRVIAGTTTGVCVSADRGVTFAPWSDGLDAAPVVALARGPDAVYAVQLGGRIWRREMAGSA